MKLTKEIFDSLGGKANGMFDLKNNVNTYLEIGIREGTTFKSRVPYVHTKCVAIDCWDIFTNSNHNPDMQDQNTRKNQYDNLVNLFKDNSKVQVIKQFSNHKETINSFENNFFDIIFIDGDHSYEGVKEDLNNWWSKCNTLFCGHDYMLTKTIWNGVECGVKKAIDEFIIEYKNEIKDFRVFTNSPNPTWFIWKK